MRRVSSRGRNALEGPMAFFEWKEEYSGGIMGIDDQHRKIIAIMNELFDGIKLARNEEVVKSVLKELIQYADYHFALEEGLFTRYKYSEESDHIAQHRHFIEKIRTLIIEDYTESRDVALETLYYLKNWFQGHMLKTDMSYCRYFKLRESVAEIDKFIKG